jgi:hypothetical protein
MFEFQGGPGDSGQAGAPGSTGKRVRYCFTCRKKGERKKLTSN